jgi:hypothetical protein
MKKKVNTYCVWRNKTDEILAIDLPAAKCAENMGITVATFYVYATRPDRTAYTIIKTEDLESEVSA